MGIDGLEGFGEGVEQAPRVPGCEILIRGLTPLGDYIGVWLGVIAPQSTLRMMMSWARSSVSGRALSTCPPYCCCWPGSRLSSF